MGGVARPDNVGETFFDGAIDDVIISNTAFSADEIADSYDSLN